MAIDVLVVLDFMCPWSFIGMRSLAAAKAQLAAAAAEAGEKAPEVRTSFIPFEFDPPGTYPAEGTDWTEYCRGYGEAKARFLLEEKLPRAFALGAALGIQFRMERRIVHTPRVNSALLLAQRHGAAEQFALAVLRAHFEALRDPNDRELLRAVLAEAGVPAAEVEALLEEPDDRLWAVSAEQKAQARSMGVGSVPRFFVTCGGGADQCAAAEQEGEATGGPTTPAYFLAAFGRCGAPAQPPQQR